MSDVVYLPPLTAEQAGLRSGCLTCGPQPITLPPEACIAVGFGSAGASRDGQSVYEESDDEYMTCADIEEMAAADPEHDWRIYFYGPLSESEYQRQNGAWVLVKKGEGFA